MTVKEILRKRDMLVKKNCRVVICDYRTVPNAWLHQINNIEKNGWAVWDGRKKDIPSEILDRIYACACVIERNARGKGIEKIAIISVV